MNEAFERFDIDSYVKPGFDIVVELDDEVEYLLDTEAVTLIKNNESTVILKRLFDGEGKTIAVDRVIESLQKDGSIDYLKIK